MLNNWNGSIITKSALTSVCIMILLSLSLPLQLQVYLLASVGVFYFTRIKCLNNLFISSDSSHKETYSILIGVSLSLIGIVVGLVGLTVGFIKSKK